MQEVINSFSSQDILNSLTKFHISISNNQIDELISRFYSIYDVCEYLISQYQPFFIIKGNLPRFIGRYWDINFQNKWSIEKLIEKIPLLYHIDEQIALENGFKDQLDYFNHLKVIVGQLSSIQNDDLIDSLEQSFTDWLTNFTFSRNTIKILSTKSWELLPKIEELINYWESEAKNSIFNFPLNIIKIKMKYQLKSKIEAFKLLEESNDYFKDSIEIIVWKIHLLLDDFDEILFLDLVTELTDIVRSKEALLFPKIVSFFIESLNILFEDIEIQNKENLLLIGKLLDTKTLNEGNTPVQKYNHLTDLLINTVLEDTQTSSSQNDIIIPNYNDEDNSMDLDELGEEDYSFEEEGAFESEEQNYQNESKNLSDEERLMDSLINGEIPLVLNFDCTSCGIRHERTVEKIFIQHNWPVLLKEKINLKDNGNTIFDDEIICPVCTNCNYLLSFDSKNLLLSIYIRISDIGIQTDTDFREVSEKILIGNWVSEHTLDAKNPEESILMLDKLIKSNPNNEILLVSKGEQLVQMNYFSDALKLLKDVLKINKNNISAIYNLMKIHFIRKNHDQAINYAYDIIRIINDDLTLYGENLSYIIDIEMMVHKMYDVNLISLFSKLFNRLNEIY